MASERVFRFSFTGDADDLGRATGQAEGHMEGLGGKLAGAATKIAGAMAAAFAVNKLTDWGTALYDIGNQAEVWNKKAGIVFGDQIGVMEEWAGSVAGSMGMTKSELLGAGAAMADLLVPMGATREQAAQMTMDMSGLSGALSAWSGGTRTAAEVNEILAKALLGEREELKGLGISIDQAEVSQRALTIAQAAGRTEVTAMDEALATQQLIMEKSTDAQTAWANGTFDAQQKQAQLSAQIKEVKEALGSALLPAVQAFTAWLVDRAIPALQQFGEWVWPRLQSAVESLRSWWNSNGPAIVGFLQGVQKAAADMGQGVAQAWSGQIRPALDQLNVAFANLQARVGELRQAVSGATGGMSVDWQRVGQVVGVVVAGIVYGLVFVTNWFSQAAHGAAVMAGIVRSAMANVQSTIDRVRDAVDWLRRAYDTMRSALSARISIPTPNWPKPPSWLSAVSPFFHSGTISVPGAPGSNVPAVLQAGETVLSRGQTRQASRGGAGGGLTVVVNAYGATGREMIAEIERAVRDGVRSDWLATAGVTA